MAACLPIVLLLANPIFSLPGPSDVSLTHRPASFLQNLKRQFTGLGPFPMPPPDRCYRRSDKIPACPYGGQCRPDLQYTCQTYCVNYGQTLDNQMSCNLPCAYEATGLAGERPINPMHCATLGERSKISCESGWACYRQFSEVGPSFEQRAPVCSPQYDECDLDDGTAAVTPAAAPAPALAPAPATPEEEPIAPLEPVAPLEPAAFSSSTSAATTAAAAPPVAPISAADEPALEESDESSQPPAAPAVIIIVSDADDNDRRKRQARLSCKPSHRCVRDPRPSLTLPARKDSTRGICVPETAKKCTTVKKGGVWTECGERGHCAEVPVKGVSGGEGLCVPLLGKYWVDSPVFAGVTVANVSVAVSAGLRRREVLRPMC